MQSHSSEHVIEFHPLQYDDQAAHSHMRLAIKLVRGPDASDETDDDDGVEQKGADGGDESHGSSSPSSSLDDDVTQDDHSRTHADGNGDGGDNTDSDDDNSTQVEVEHYLSFQLEIYQLGMSTR